MQNTLLLPLNRINSAISVSQWKDQHQQPDTILNQGTSIMGRVWVKKIWIPLKWDTILLVDLRLDFA
jgi:hypothetical protein